MRTTEPGVCRQSANCEPAKRPKQHRDNFPPRSLRAESALRRACHHAHHSGYKRSSQPPRATPFCPPVSPNSTGWGPTLPPGTLLWSPLGASAATPSRATKQLSASTKAPPPAGPPGTTTRSPLTPWPSPPPAPYTVQRGAKPAARRRRLLKSSRSMGMRRGIALH